MEEHTMDILWKLLALALASVFYVAWQILRFVKRAFRTRKALVPLLGSRRRGVSGSAWPRTRPIRQISMGAFAAVLAETPDLIVIDLRADSQRTPFPIPTAQVLPVNPNELVEVLEWLPANKSAAFCGVSNLAVLTIETSFCMGGSAPLYLLPSDSSRAEVA
jgi:hypothetical protein